MKRVCVFCGANTGNRIEYVSATKNLAGELVNRNIEIVFGGGRIGLMGILADEAIKLGGKVTGIIPKALATKEVAHDGVYELRIVGSMHERKEQMAEISDAFISLPGGIGTLDETFELLTWCQLGYHSKPCGLLNVTGYYDKLVEFLDYTVEENFFKQSHRDMLIVEQHPKTLLDRLSVYKVPRVEQLLSENQT